jgi:Uma2 family endonuclease
MAAQSSPLTLEEFHKLYDGAKPAYEYWHGVAVRKSMPTFLHGLVQFVIMTLLKNAGWTTAPEVRLKVVSDVEPVPDVIAIRGKAKGGYPTSAPELCVEILSPGDTLARAIRKAKTYISWGSQAAWIIDPEMRTAWMLLCDGASEPVWVPPTGSLRAGDTTVDPPELFAEVDRQIESAGEQE